MGSSGRLEDWALAAHGQPGLGVADGDDVGAAPGPPPIGGSDGVGSGSPRWACAASLVQGIGGRGGAGCASRRRRCTQSDLRCRSLCRRRSNPHHHPGPHRSRRHKPRRSRCRRRRNLPLLAADVLGTTPAAAVATGQVAAAARRGGTQASFHLELGYRVRSTVKPHLESWPPGYLGHFAIYHE